MSVYPWVLKNTDVIESESVSFPFDDCGFLYGYGLFETIRILNKTPLFLSEHLGRLQYSSIIMDLVFDTDIDQINRSIHTLIEKNNIENGVLNLYLTGGNRPDSMYELGLEMPFFLGVVREYPVAPLDPLLLGVRHASFQRISLDHLKTMASVKNILEKRLAPSFNDVLLYDSNNIVLETTTANVFFVKGKTICTPKGTGILQGITRNFLISKCNDYGFSVEERDIPVSELADFDEIFLTNALRGILLIETTEGYDGLSSRDLVTTIKQQYTASIDVLSQVSSLV